MPTAREAKPSPSLSEELSFWLWKRYGSYDEDSLRMGVLDMDKIARGIPVERWGCPFEVLK